MARSRGQEWDPWERGFGGPSERASAVSLVGSCPPAFPGVPLAPRYAIGLETQPRQESQLSRRTGSLVGLSMPTKLPPRGRVPRVVAAPLPPRAKLHRAKGTGSVSREACGFRARGPAPERRNLGLFDTEAGAAAALTHPERGRPVGEWCESFLAYRVTMRLRSVPGEVNRYRTHVRGDALGAMALGAVDVPAARAWLGRMMLRTVATPAHMPARAPRLLSAHTVCRALSLLRSAWTHAVDLGVLERNPWREVRVPRSAYATSEEDFPGVIDGEEQARVLAELPQENVAGVLTRVAIGVGIRRGELLALRWEDVHLGALEPCIVVRYGSHGKPVKGGKPRRLPLFGVALEALISWRARFERHAPAPHPGKR